MSARQDQPSLEKVWKSLENSARAIEEAMEALGGVRGQTMGRPSPAATEAGTTERSEELEFLLFSLGRERYAIEQSYVRGVFSDSITPLPGAGRALVGIALIEGTLTPIFDLGPLLGLPPTDRGEAKIVVLGSPAIEIGLLAEGPNELATLDTKRFASIPWRLDPSIARLVRGVSPDGTTVLEGAAILSDERFFIDLLSPAAAEAADQPSEPYRAW